VPPLPSYPHSVTWERGRDPCAVPEAGQVIDLFGIGDSPRLKRVEFSGRAWTGRCMHRPKHATRRPPSTGGGSRPPG